MDSFFSLELVSLIFFVVALVASPGPAVIAIIQTGLNYGFRAAMLVIAGIVIGFVVNITLTSLPLAFLFTRYGISKNILAGLGLLYIFFLAYKLSVVKTSDITKKKNRLTAVNSFFIMLLNPKAYVVNTATLANFSLGFENGSAGHFIAVGGVIVLTAFICDTCWAWLSSLASGFKFSPKTLLLINRSLAALMVLSVTWVFFTL